VAQLMDLVRELKTLNQKKLEGQLTSTDEARRQELRSYLATQLPEATNPGVRPVSSASGTPVRPAVAPTPTPTPASSTPRPPTPPTSTAAPQAAPAPAKYANQYALQADALIQNALASDAVKALDPYNKRAQASPSEIDEVTRRADAALAANRPRQATDTAGIITQLSTQPFGYEPDFGALSMSEYYADAANQGLQTASASEAAQLPTVDPREGAFLRVAERLGNRAFTAPSGLEFLDDFPALYQKRIVAPMTAATPTAAADPDQLIHKRKVTIHLLNGTTKQGQVRSFRRQDTSLRLEGAVPEDVVCDRCKAIFVHTQNNGVPTITATYRVQVTFLDGRSIQGTTEDAQASPLLLFPAPGRGNVELVIIQRGAIQSVQ
jgi:hypothetical protein